MVSNTIGRKAVRVRFPLRAPLLTRTFISSVRGGSPDFECLVSRGLGPAEPEF